MATVDKNFRVKNGLVVEGTTGTINGNNIVTDADTTDIISEGTTNLYFTDGRVQDVIVNAVQENISITSTDGVLYITAENGVGDSTTDDLQEGTVNLYFTAQRVLDVVSEGGEGFTTDSVDEGTTNLYFTDQRAIDAVINGAVDTDDIEEGTTNLYYTDARVESVIAASDTDDLAEGTINLYYTDARVENVIASSDTDDISEGTTNLYYTTQRVYDALAASVQENISVTTTDGMLYITAENGVADATTDDLDEGTTNLYFTDQRAVDALEAVVPNFTSVEINSVSKQVAATTEVTASATPTAVFTFDSAEYRSAKFLVKGAFGDHTEISEVLLTLDALDNIAITEYAIVGTNGNLINVTATYSAGDVVLQVSAVNANTDVTVFGTLIV